MTGTHGRVAPIAAGVALVPTDSRDRLLEEREVVLASEVAAIAPGDLRWASARTASATGSSAGER